MTMDEITGLFDDLDRAYYAYRFDSYQASRAALLRAVEGIVRERDEAKARVPDPERIAQMQRIAEGNAAVALSCHSRAETAESALAAMRREVEDRRDRWLSADPAPSPFDAGTLRLAGTELRLMLARLAASPPPAAMSTETAPTPTKSKEDPTP